MSLFRTRLAVLGWKFFGALFLEQKNTKPNPSKAELKSGYAVSLGRITFLIVMGYMIYLWTRSLSGASASMPPGLLEVFYVLASYIFGGKIVNAVRNKLSRDQEE